MGRRNRRYKKEYIEPEPEPEIEDDSDLEKEREYREHCRRVDIMYLMKKYMCEHANKNHLPLCEYLTFEAVQEFVDYSTTNWNKTRSS